MASLENLVAREVLDSRGRPTVEVEAFASGGAYGRAIVPSGASTGHHEALELRDPPTRTHGPKGVKRAVGHVLDPILPAIRGMDVADLASIDATLIALDGTPNKSKLGANAILGVSLAIAHAAADAAKVPLYEHFRTLWAHHNHGKDVGPATLPMPMVNMISGGLHAGRNLDFQDFLTIPLAARDFPEALEITVALYRSLGEVLARHGEESALVGDEGGYGPKLRNNAEALDRILESIRDAGLEPGEDVGIALDVASTHFFDPSRGHYVLGGSRLLPETLVEIYEKTLTQYPIISIEDGLAEDDWSNWATLTERLGEEVQLIGDDLFATQSDRIRRGVTQRAGNAVLIKLNQVGTVSETLDALALARANNFRVVVSARSGETEDSTIADLAVGTAAGQIKIGSVARSERLAKYNRLLRIHDSLGTGATFAGRAALGK